MTSRRLTPASGVDHIRHFQLGMEIILAALRFACAASDVRLCPLGFSGLNHHVVNLVYTLWALLSCQFKMEGEPSSPGPTPGTPVLHSPDEMQMK